MPHRISGAALPIFSAVISGVSDVSFESCQVVPSTAVKAMAASAALSPVRAVVNGAMGR